jgi:hypothetical protein
MYSSLFLTCVKRNDDKKKKMQKRKLQVRHHLKGDREDDLNIFSCKILVINFSINSFFCFLCTVLLISHLYL